MTRIISNWLRAKRALLSGPRDRRRMTASARGADGRRERGKMPAAASDQVSNKADALLPPPRFVAKPTAPSVKLAAVQSIVSWCFFFSPALGGAHQPSDSYLTLAVSQNHLQGRWDIALRDLDYALKLDANDDGAITWGEVRAKLPEISAYALTHLELRSGQKTLSLENVEHKICQHSDGGYVVLLFETDPPRRSLGILYRAFEDLDPQHRGLLQLKLARGVRTAVLVPGNELHSFDLAAGPDAWGAFVHFGREGVWHIWIGFDHILFLAVLLMPALAGMNSGTGPRPHFIKRMVGIISAFTVAHSITLTLMVLGGVRLPAGVVEPAIALSIIAAALNNVAPFMGGRTWLLAFGFGLLHGFGFGNVLLDLGIEGGTLGLALVSFNLGVELGQLAIVAAFLPIAWGMQRLSRLRTLPVQLGSAAAAGVAGVWFFERILNLKLLPF